MFQQDYPTAHRMSTQRTKKLFSISLEILLARRGEEVYYPHINQTGGA